MSYKFIEKIFKKQLTIIRHFAILLHVDCAGEHRMLRTNGGSSSVVERQIVDLVVEGSNPFFHPRHSSE